MTAVSDERLKWLIEATAENADHPQAPIYWQEYVSALRELQQLRASRAQSERDAVDARRWRDCVEHDFPHLGVTIKGAYWWCYRNDSGAVEYQGKTIQEAVDSRLAGPPTVTVTQSDDSALAALSSTPPTEEGER